MEFIIVFALGALCFGCGYLTAFIVTRTKLSNEMIKRGAARYKRRAGIQYLDFGGFSQSHLPVSESHATSRGLERQ